MQIRTEARPLTERTFPMTAGGLLEAGVAAERPAAEVVAVQVAGAVAEPAVVGVQVDRGLVEPAAVAVQVDGGVVEPAVVAVQVAEEMLEAEVVGVRVVAVAAVKPRPETSRSATPHWPSRPWAPAESRAKNRSTFAAHSSILRRALLACL